MKKPKSLQLICMIKLTILNTRNLQQALNHGLILKGVQNALLKPYIDTNTDLRKTTKSNFQKDYF